MPPPGVVIMDEGSANFALGGGVDGGSILLRGGLAGEGDAAKYNSRSAPSSPDLVSFAAGLSLGFLAKVRLRIGGVLGGDTRIWPA